MGALHKGHLSLVECARKECRVVVVSIFVNPAQFDDRNDLRNYPRMEDRDVELLKSAGADIVFIPSVEEVYPEPDTRLFDFGDRGRVMEGATRPGHFNGVAQVVSRLFDLINPGRAYFGKKDFQQIAIVKAMVSQLGYKVEIVGCDTVRDEDGLALSSRNLLLDTEHRAAAPMIYTALKEGVRLSRSESVEEIEKRVRQSVERSPLLKVIYFEIVDAATLQQVRSWDDATEIQGCIAVKAGNIRLIDNIQFR